MLPIERKERILNELVEHKTIYIDDIALKLNISAQTVRRDLMILEEQGYVERHHGGIAKLVDTSKELPLQHRLNIYSERKEAIGKLAAEMVEEGDTIFIDSGTTTATMIKYLELKNVRVFSNGILQLTLLEQSSIETVLIGGTMVRNTGSFIGAQTIESVSKLHFDKVFLGANGISKKMGFTNADPTESSIKEILIKQSNQAYVLADSSKIGLNSFHFFSKLNAVTLITDSKGEHAKDFIEKILIAKK